MIIFLFCFLTASDYFSTLVPDCNKKKPPAAA